ncbi:hypothetical protein [Oceanisphaera sp. W20_SRM_FM3]|uniref:hypothetical protein n=1 Tax=Oceanisphaera sp. W20_SRM_FM3 TaxID=3240267 RepID=UPI003F9EB7EF
MINVQFLPQSPVVPGQAQLLIKKWQGGLEGLEFSIQRNQDRYYLQSKPKSGLQSEQEWGNNAVWFPIALTENADGDLTGLIGAEIIDPVLEGSGTASYQLLLQQGQGGESDRGTVRLSSELLASAAAGSTASTHITGELTPIKVVEPAIAEPAIAEPAIAEPAIAEPAIVEPAITEPVIVEPEIVEPVIAEPEQEVTEPAAEPSQPEPAKKKKGLNPLFIVLPILTLLAILAAVAWFMLKPSGEGAPEATAADSAESADMSCSIAGLSSQSELSFVQNCIQQKMSSEQLLAVINGAKEAEQCGVAQRLYANRAQSGDVQIALAYAKEYDPEFHQPNPCFTEPDDATASYWYETVLATEPDNEQAQQRLGALN